MIVTMSTSRGMMDLEMETDPHTANHPVTLAMYGRRGTVTRGTPVIRGIPVTLGITHLTPHRHQKILSKRILLTRRRMDAMTVTSATGTETGIDTWTDQVTVTA